MSAFSKRTYFFLLITSLFVSTAHANSWRLDHDENGIKVHTRDVPGSQIREFKSEIVLDSTLDAVMAVFDDIANFPSWNHQCSKAAPLKKIGIYERYHYQNINMPFPVKNRDLFIRSQVSQSGDTVTIKSSAVPQYCEQNQAIKACESLNNNKNINITKSTGTHQFIPQADGKIKVTWRQHVEPAGNIPKWVINSMLVDIPYNTLSKLKQQVKKPKYKQAKLKRENGKIMGF